MSKEAKGGLLILTAALFWGVSGTVAKIIFNGSINPIELANMRMSLAFVTLFLFFFIKNRKILKVKRNEIKDLVILGIFGFTAVQISYYYTIALLNVSMAIFLQYLAPILITIYCVVFMKEKLSFIKVGSLVLAILGSFFIIYGAGSGDVKIKGVGLITGLASAVFSAFYTIYSKKCTNKHSPWTVLVYGMGSGAILYNFISPPWILWSGRSLTEVAFALYIVLFATIIPFGLYLNGLKYLLPTAAGVLSMLEPVVASITAYFILGERMSLLQSAGAAAVLGAILLLQYHAVKSKESEIIEQNKEEELIKEG